jgi:hypothetical protein
MAAGSGIRIGDTERNATAESLREHYAAGRLTMEEFQERLDAAFAAKTDLDLGKITDDLPHSSAFSAYAASFPSSGQRAPFPTYPSSGGQRTPPRSGSWQSILAGVAMLVSFFALATIVILWLPFGGLPRTILLVFAVFAFIRRILRRVVGGGSSGGRRRWW